jgi:hypothetical protein
MSNFIQKYFYVGFPFDRLFHVVRLAYLGLASCPKGPEKTNEAAG